ncbi:MAG: DMT family transporter [Bauldia sp.]|nr:DMT family transporter [Bauldia sp.]MCW5777289.1 DMT family transporter [Phycisphaeraceae bacterium]
MHSLRSSRLWPGVPLALASAVLFGALAPISKSLIESLDAQLAAGLLYLGAGVGLALVHAGRRSAGMTALGAPPRRADAGWLVAVWVFGGVVAPVLLMLGLARTSGASASLLLNLEGVATMAIAWLVFRENVDRRLLLGAAAIVAGSVALSWSAGGLRFDAGALFVIGACVAWGIDNNLTRKLSALDPVLLAMSKGLAAGVFNIAIALARGAAIPPASIAGAVAVVGFVGIGLSLVLFIVALRHLGAARTGAYYALAPFIGVVVAIAILNEPVTTQLLVAAVLMGVGLWLHLAERHEHEHEHEGQEHEHRHVHDAHHQHEHDGLDSRDAEPHSHSHRHTGQRHAHAHYPDLHHRHRHDRPR